MRTVHVGASVDYDVLIGEGLIDRAGALAAQVVAPCSIMLVTDSNVNALYADRVEASFARAGYGVSKFVFEVGEASKHILTLSDILEAMAENQMTRSDIVVALGGGVVGDMAGFAAAVYARGIRFIQIPTTLLAAVDSSVGGKTAVDLKAGKNLAGAFHQPSLVITDTDVLRALPDDILSCGAAEAIKTGVLFDEALFDTLAAGGLRDNIDAVVVRCVELKRDVVAGDEFDTGARALLNLGHTFGHAIEHCSNLTVSHGQGVAIGMLMAASSAGGDDALIRRIADCVVKCGLSTHCDYDADALTAAALTDKKRAGGTITLVLPKAIGKCYLLKIPVSELRGYFERALHRQEVLGL